VTAVTGASLMTEAELDVAVRELAALLGVRVYSVRNSRAGIVSSRGWPDLTLVGPGGIAWRELKAERGHATREQLEWGRAIADAGGSWKIWRPQDLMDRVVERELRAIARTTAPTVLTTRRPAQVTGHA
jgi:hypothetical protein